MCQNHNNIEFIKEQYSQYWEMKRKHLSFSWQIPSLTIVAVVALVGFDPTKLEKWINMPLVPAISFFMLGIFVALMFVHHRRNLIYANIYDKFLAEFEEKYGEKLEIHHFQVNSKLPILNQISSSSFLSVFLILLFIGLIAVSIYFFTTYLALFCKTS